MGAWGAANTAMKMASPRLASAWARHPIWQMYRRSSAGWAGDGWSSGMPFKATVGVAPSTLGTVASNVLTDTGAVWGGAGGYADTPNWIATHPATDFPFIAWSITKNDGFASFAEQLQASTALQGIHAGHAWVWTMGQHDTGFDTSGVLDADFFGAIAGVSYNKTHPTTRRSSA
jgi:hypothetical protein